LVMLGRRLVLKDVEIGRWKIVSPYVHQLCPVHRELLRHMLVVV
jgi:hypothetical protein